MNYSAIAAPDLGLPPAHAPAASNGPAKAAPPPKAAAPAQPAPRELLTDGERQIMDKHTSTDASSSQTYMYRRKLILKIRSYATAFPKEVGHQVSAKDLENFGEAQLESLLAEIKFTVGSRSSSIVTNQTAGVGLIGLEGFLKDSWGKEVAGPAVRLSDLMQSEDCQYLIKELSLEYADIIYQRPELRAAVYLFNAVNTIDQLNRKALDDAVKPQPVPPVGDKRKEPDTPVQQQPVAPQVPRTDQANDVHAVVIEELPVARMPPPKPAEQAAVVVPAVLKAPPGPVKPKPMPSAGRK